MWAEFAADPKVTDLLGRSANPRGKARAFVHNSLVDGFVMHPVIAPAMAGAIAVSGHTDLKTFELYVKKADRKRLAAAAMAKRRTANVS
jgi:hypothetical protein